MSTLNIYIISLKTNKCHLRQTLLSKVTYSEHETTHLQNSSSFIFKKGRREFYIRDQDE